MSINKKPHHRNISSHYPSGWNMRVIPRITEDAARLMSWKLSIKDVREIARYRHYYPLEDTKEWLDSFDVQWIDTIMRFTPDWWTRWNILDTANSVAWHLLDKKPDLLKDFVEIIIETLKSNQVDNADNFQNSNTFSLLQRFKIKYNELDKYSEEEYLEFYRRYSRVISLFADIESYKTDSILENLLRSWAWKNYFLWLELTWVEANFIMGWDLPWMLEIFRQIHEDEIRSLALICDKKSFWRYSKNLLTFYHRSKKIFRSDHTKIWERIRMSFQDNPLGSIFFESGVYLSENTEDANRELFFSRYMSEIEFLWDLWRKIQSKLDRFGLEKLLWLRKKIKKKYWESDDVCSSVLWVLAWIHTEYLSDYIKAIDKNLDILPPVDKLQELILESERLGNKIRNPFEARHECFLSYLIRFQRIRESRHDLERFIDKIWGQYIVNVIDKLPQEYESNWHENPLYERSIQTKLINPNNPKEDLLDTSSIFLSLGNNGLDIAQCERLYADMSKSKDAYTDLNNFYNNWWRNQADFASMASLLQFRPKSYRRVLRNIFPIFHEYVRDISFSSFFRHVLWKKLNPNQLQELRWEWGGSYRERVTSLCYFLWKDPSEYEKAWLWFQKATQFYPDISSNIDKFRQFEDLLITLETESMNKKVCDYYIQNAWLDKEELTPDMLAIDAIMVIIKSLVTNYSNKEIWKKLLRKMIAKKNEPFSYSWDESKNQEWFDENLTLLQNKLWNSENRKTYPVTSEFRKTDETMLSEINKFLRVAEGLVDSLWLSLEINTQDYEIFLVELAGFFEKNPTIDIQIKKNIELQAASIKRVLNRWKERSIREVSIYHEINTSRIVMMGDWVDGSCLSSSSNIKNTWSVIANACEWNKGVFYAQDEKWNILWRLLVAIDSQNRLVLFWVYTKWSPDIDLQKVFERYIRDFSRDIELSLWWDPKKVEKILDCDWYIDPVWTEVSPIVSR